GGGRGARDVQADVLGALREAIVEAPRCLEHLARAREDLASHEEGDERLGQALKWHVAAHEVVLVAAVAVARRVGVVLEKEDGSWKPVLVQPGAGGPRRSARPPCRG